MFHVHILEIGTYLGEERDYESYFFVCQIVIIPDCKNKSITHLWNTWQTYLTNQMLDRLILILKIGTQIKKYMQSYSVPMIPLLL